MDAGGGGAERGQRQELKYRSEEAFKLNFYYRDTYNNFENLVSQR